MTKKRNPRHQFTPLSEQERLREDIAVLRDGGSANPSTAALSMSKAVEPTLFYQFLPTAERDPNDPVVRVMRENPGRWIAWNEATRAVIAIADDYSEAMAGVGDPDDPQVMVDVAPGMHPDAAIYRPLELLAWESPNVLDDVRLLWGESADTWLDHPNAHFGGRPPRQLVGTEEERRLRELLRAVRDGMTS